MNKKGIEWGLVFIFSVALIALFFFGFFLYHKYSMENVQDVIIKDIDVVESNHYLLSFLDTESQYGRFSDLIVISYSRNDFVLLKQEIDRHFMSEGSSLGWELQINRLVLKENFRQRGVYFEDSAVLPGADRNPIRIRLRLSKG